MDNLKAIKNPTEIEGFRRSHIRDGVALARYFAWLEEQLDQGVKVNESRGADQLDKFRWLAKRHDSGELPLTTPTRELDLYRGISFKTISAAGPNAGTIYISCINHRCFRIKFFLQP